MDKWTYELNVNSDIWHGDIFDTREEAIREAIIGIAVEDYEEFKVGIIDEPTNFGVDVDNVIENIKDAMYEEIGEVSEDYLEDATTEERLELEQELNKVFYKWQEKYNHKPTFYKVISEEIISIK